VRATSIPQGEREGVLRRRIQKGAAVGAAALVALFATASVASAKSHERVCPAVTGKFAACLAEVVTNAQGKPAATTTPSGYGPADLRSAYKLTATGSSSQTVAIVDAYDDPTAAADLGVYRSTYGLSACTTANGCFRKVNQTGGTTPPRANGSWAQEISLDLDMASAICPGCKILLVEANSAAFTDLSAAVDTAARLGGTVISNSYGGPEFSQETSATYASHYNHPGIPITVSSGDAGYGVEFPAASPYVTAVGGTTLNRASNARGWAESAWSGAGSGCSAYVAKPSWQTDTGCARRTVADVSAVANPNTGVAVYDSTRYQGASGWMVFGGTSASSPIVASVYALGTTATGRNGSGNPVAHTWATPGGLNDVTSGTNGTCATAVWCTSGTGWDGPTGLGTPNGTSSF
jgi:subtilase family serine protease